MQKRSDLKRGEIFIKILGDDFYDKKIVLDSLSVWS